MMAERKRDRLRKLLRGSPKPPAAPPAAPPPATDPAQHAAAPSTTPSPSLLDRALARLPEDQKATLRAQLPASPLAAADAVTLTHDAASKCQRVSSGAPESTRADKVLQLIGRFKSIGDLAANADPVHAGLPWAGVRLLLDIASAHAARRRAVLAGLELALDAAGRLGVYAARLLPRVPAGDARENLESALVRMYAHVLGFLADAIAWGQRSRVGQVGDALWRGDDEVSDFEAVCDRLAARVETAARQCEEELRRQDRDELRRELQCLDNIHHMSDGLRRLDIAAELNKLVTAKGAAFDSEDESQYEAHLAGTRVKLLEDIRAWAHDPAGKCIFWLCGMAGTGKSTIARTVAQRLKADGLLGASFFFKRTVADRARATLFFTTIARQLADQIPGMDVEISRALKSDSGLAEQKNIEDQFSELLLRPLAAVGHDRTVRNLVIVVDALDECTNGSDVRRILNLFKERRAELALRLRVFVTSRRQSPVELGFQRIDQEVHEDVKLEEVQAQYIASDIRTYFQHRFDKIKADDKESSPYDPLPSDWPETHVFEELVNLATPLFIAAFTICEFVSSQPDPRSSLRALISVEQRHRFEGLAQIYLPILEQLVCGRSRSQKEETITSFKQIVGPLLLLAEPLSAASLAELLNISLRHIDAIVNGLSSVLYVPRDKNKPIRAFHLSFREVLVDSSLQQGFEFGISKELTHGRLADACIELLEKSLRQDVCSLYNPSTRRVDVTQKDIELAIPIVVAYACRYWLLHLSHTDGRNIADNGPLHKFLRLHFLHWIETMAWLGQLSDAVHQMGALSTMLTKKQSCQAIVEFLFDAQRFVVRFRTIIDKAPLQLYLSALIFAPSSSIVRKTFASCILPTQLHVIPHRQAGWGKERLTINLDRRLTVIAVAFSPDGAKLAAVSRRRTIRAPLIAQSTIRVWDTMTGEETDRLKGPDEEVRGLCFSHSEAVICTYYTPDCTVVWSAKSRCVLYHCLKSGSAQDDWEAFSANGLILAIPTSDWSLVIWSVETFREVRRIKLFTPSSARFPLWTLSTSGTKVTVLDAGGYLRRWDAATGQEELMFSVFVTSNAALTIASSENYIALGMQDHSTTDIEVWKVAVDASKRVYSKSIPMVVKYELSFATNVDVLYVAFKSCIVEVNLAPNGTLVRSHNLEALAHLRHMVPGPNRDTVAIWQGEFHAQTIRIWDLAPDKTSEEERRISPTLRLHIFVPSCAQYALAYPSRLGDSCFLLSFTTQEWLLLGNARDDQATASRWLLETLVEAEMPHTLEKSSTTREEHAMSSGDSREVVSADKQLSVIISDGGLVQLHDLETGRERSRMHLAIEASYGPPYSVSHVVGASVVAIVFQEAIILVDEATGQRYGDIKLRTTSAEHTKHYTVEFLPDEVSVVVTREDGYLLVCNRESGNTVMPTYWERPIALSSRYVAMGYWDHSVRLWAARDGTLVQTFLDHKHVATALALSKDDSLLVSSSVDQTLRLWHTGTGHELHRWAIPPSSLVHSIALSDDGHTVVTISSVPGEIDDYCTVPGWICVWKSTPTATTASTATSTATSTTETKPLTTEGAYQQTDIRIRPGAHVAICPKGRIIAAYASGFLHTFDIRGREITERSQLQLSFYPTYLSFVDDGRSIATDHGVLKLKEDGSALYERLELDEQVDIVGDWVRYEEKDILHLPAGYGAWPHCPTVVSHSGVLCVGQPQGIHVFVLKKREPNC